MTDVATRLAPRLAASVEEGDALRRLLDATWQDLLEGGFLRAPQPQRRGGGELSFVEFLDGEMKVAEGNASAGRVAGVIGAQRWQLALFPEQAQEEMWAADASVLRSSSYPPTRTAHKVGGGYRASSRWSFSSGCDHCRAVNLGAVAGMHALGDTELPDFPSFILYCDQYQIIDNWQTAGMRGTGSEDIVVDGVLVPACRCQSQLDYAFNISFPVRETN